MRQTFRGRLLSCRVSLIGAASGEASYAEPAQAVEVTEELVGAVDEVRDHFGTQQTVHIGCRAVMRYDLHCVHFRLNGR